MEHDTSFALAPHVLYVGDMMRCRLACYDDTVLTQLTIYLQVIGEIRHGLMTGPLSQWTVRDQHSLSRLFSVQRMAWKSWQRGGQKEDNPISWTEHEQPLRFCAYRQYMMTTYCTDHCNTRIVGQFCNQFWRLLIIHGMISTSKRCGKIMCQSNFISHICKVPRFVHFYINPNIVVDIAHSDIHTINVV